MTTAPVASADETPAVPADQADKKPAISDRPHWWGVDVVTALVKLTPTDQLKGDRQALAHLKRFVTGQYPAGRTAAIVLKALPDNASPTRVRQVLFVASMYAHHQSHSAKAGNLGTSLGRLPATGGRDDAIDMLVNTLRPRLEDVLQTTIFRLKSAGIPVDYVQLLGDVIGWDDDRLDRNNMPRSEGIRLRLLTSYQRSTFTNDSKDDSK